MNTLYETYEYVEKNYDGDTKNKPFPIFHLEFQSQITIFLNDKGEFIKVELVDKKDAKTLTPINEKSASRTNGIFPHPLFDNLTYVAKGLYQNMDNDKKTKNAIESNDAYLGLLGTWKNKSGNKMLDIVYNYLSNGTIVDDLVNNEVLELDMEGKLSNKKISNIEQSKLFVRFSIISDGKINNLWENEELQNSYVNFLNDGSEVDNDYCYITGKKLPSASTHGKYIRFSGDQAKLISSNDNTYFTFRGRMDKAEECAVVGSEVSEKAHSALRWLINTQGGHIKDGYTVISWSVKNSESIKLLSDSDDIFSLEDDELEAKTIETSKDFALAFNKRMAGYKAKYEPDTKINVMALDNATPGRIAVVYYREFHVGELLDRVEKWHKDCSWKHDYKKDKESGKYSSFIGAPSPNDIILTAYGTQQNEFMKVDDKLYKSQLKQLLPCITEGKRIPVNFVMGAYRSACNPNSKTIYNWRKSLSIACSLIRKYNIDRKGKIYDMKLEEDNNKDRSYLFGRLLAVADRAEEYALYLKGNSDTRMTTAKRYMDVFSKKPSSTWKNIRMSLNPYLNALKPGTRNYYENLINKITEEFTFEDFVSNKMLEPQFLLGYSTQYLQLRNEKFKEVENKDEENNNEE